MVGFDDIFPASLCDPPLTTVHQPIRRLGEVACDRLTERIADPSLRPKLELLPTELVPAVKLRLPAGHRRAPGSQAHSAAQAGDRRASRTGRLPLWPPSHRQQKGRWKGICQFILRRLAFYLVAAWVAITANFFIPRAMPGNAVQAIMSKFPGSLQPAAYNAIAASSAWATRAHCGTST